MKTNYDVVVVGSGPAGAVAAHTLATAGASVLLIDKDQFPREKVCGDGLIADSLRVLEGMGLENTVRSCGYTSSEMEFWSPSHINARVAIDMVTIRRRTFDALLRDAAIQAGAHFECARVTNVCNTLQGVVVEVEGGKEYFARSALIGTGAAMKLPVRDATEVGKPYAASLRMYIRSTYSHEVPVIAYERSLLPGYGWIFPLGNGWYNVGVYSLTSEKVGRKIDLRKMLGTFEQTFPIARRIFSEQQEIQKPRGSVVRCNLSGVHPKGTGNILFVGETIGTTFSFTGEGIGKAMASGELASQRVLSMLQTRDASKLEGYVADVEALRPKYLGYQVAERWLTHPQVVNFLGWSVRRSPRIKGVVTDILTEQKDPRELFSLLGLWRAFVR